MMHLQMFLPLQAHAYSEIGYQTWGPEIDISSRPWRTAWSRTHAKERLKIIFILLLVHSSSSSSPFSRICRSPFLF
ncbi:unnamed protein product, partial [Vitis vinifera]